MEPDKRVQPAATAGGGGGGKSVEPGLGKRMMQVLRAVYHMLRRGLCRKRLMMDLHLLLGRGKLAGRAVRNLVAAAAHQHPHGASAAGQLVPAYSSGAGAAASASSLFSPDPRDVEFSCTTTPSTYAPLGGARASLFPFRIRGRGSAAGGRGGKYGGLNVAEVARAFEMMNAQDQQAAAGTGGETPSSSSAAQLATPSPLLALSLGRSAAGVRQLRVTDSPFPIDPEGVDERVDAEADDFIKRFYQQIWLQQASATPDNCARRRA